jgi:DNA-binding XRE family transcriptional regulator
MKRKRARGTTPSETSVSLQTLTLNGQSFVVLPREEYDRLQVLARAADLPPYPRPDEDGNYPAVEYATVSIARDIIRERAGLGITQRQLATLAGIRFETLCRIERGTQAPTVATVERIDRALKKAARKKPNGRA